MTELEEKIFDFIEKTIVLIKIDKNKTIEKIWGIDDYMLPEDRPTIYAYSIKIDNCDSFGDFSNRLLSLQDRFNNYIIKNIENQASHKELNSLFSRIRVNFDQAYANYDLKSSENLSDSDLLFIDPFSSKKYLEPRIVIEIKGGYIYDIVRSDVLKTIYSFLEKKIEFIRDLYQQTNYYSVLIKRQDSCRSLRTLQFKDLRLINSKRTILFRDKLTDYKLIDKIELSHFTTCFSGRESKQKINWKKSEVSLIYFFRKLIEEERLLHDINTKWEELSNSFTLKSKPIIPNKIETSYSKKCKTLSLKHMIDDSIELLDLRTKEASNIKV